MIGSVAEWAKRHGISRQAAYKRLKAHGISITSLGKVDFERADGIWAASMNLLQQQRGAGAKQSRTPMPSPSAPPVSDHQPATSVPSLALSQARREALRVKREAIELAKLQGELVAANEIESQVEARFRADSEALLNWPMRVSAEMAAELGIAERRCRDVLRKFVRQFMVERSMLPGGAA